MSIPLDDLPGYNDLTDREKYIVIAFRTLVEDHKSINQQVGDWLEPHQATAMSALSISNFIGTLERHLMDELRN